MKSQPVSADRMISTIRTGFISAYVPDDIASATAADDMSRAGPTRWRGVVEQLVSVRLLRWARVPMAAS
ncbi:MAG: hypothetical protein V9F03_01865 [Microthrixaceae bacterium]